MSRENAQQPRGDSYEVKDARQHIVVRPNEVKGFVTTGGRKPDRFFYILYGDTVWECDGYRVGPTAAPDDSPEVNWSLLIICPKCGGNLRIDSLKKHLGVEAGQAGLESEPLQCSYKAEFSGLCPFRVVLERPSKRHERVVTVDGGRQVRIDAVAKDCRR